MPVQIRRWVLLAAMGLFVGACSYQGVPAARPTVCEEGPTEFTTALPTSQVNHVILQVGEDAGLRGIEPSNHITSKGHSTALDGSFTYEAATAILYVTTLQQPNGTTRIMVSSKGSGPICDVYIKRLREALAAAAELHR